MRKTFVILRWIALGLIVPGILALLAYIFFPFAYLLRKPLRSGRKYKFWKYIVIPLWIFLDDEEYERQGHDFGEPWWRKAKGLKIDTNWQKFKVAYLWCAVRNPVWNMYELIRVRQGEHTIRDASGRLTQDGPEVNIMNFAVLKYVDFAGIYMDNKGPYLSLVYSILGKSKVWYTTGGRLYWRYSYAGKKFGRWIEIQAGTTDLRYTLRFKIKTAIPFEERTEAVCIEDTRTYLGFM